MSKRFEVPDLFEKCRAFLTSNEVVSDALKLFLSELYGFEDLKVLFSDKYFYDCLGTNYE